MRGNGEQVKGLEERKGKVGGEEGKGLRKRKEQRQGGKRFELRGKEGKCWREGCGRTRI